MGKSAAERMRAYRARHRLYPQQPVMMSNFTERQNHLHNSKHSSTDKNDQPMQKSRRMSESNFQKELSDYFCIPSFKLSDYSYIPCSICDSVYHKILLKPLNAEHKQILWKSFPGLVMSSMVACESCSAFLMQFTITHRRYRNCKVLWCYMLRKILFRPNNVINLVKNS